MGKKKGYVILYRDIAEDWIWSDKPFAKGQAFIDLILMAGYEPKKICINGKPELLDTGEFHTSITKLAERWGVSWKTAQGYLNTFEKDGKITSTRRAHGTTIKVSNYAKYQTFSEKSDERSTEHSTYLSTEQSTYLSTGLSTDKQYNKYNKDINSINSSSSYSSSSSELFESFWSRYPKKRKRRETEKLFKEMRIDQGELEQILKGLDKWIECEDWKKNDGQYIQSPDKFLQNQQWKEKPRTSKPINQYSGHKSDAEVSYDTEQWKSDVIKPPVYRRNY